MFNKRAIRGWRQMLANQGVVPTARTVAERLMGRLRRKPNSWHQPTTPPIDAAPAIHSFDRTFKVDTSGLIWGEDLATGSRSDRWNTAYYGIAPSVFRTVLTRIENHLGDAVFIDMGSGKGRGVMLAMSYPFKAIYGVELAPQLHSIAQTNLEHYRQIVPTKSAVHLLRMDAVQFEFPLEPLILFFYHPFCRPVLQRVLRNLEQSLLRHPRPVHILYINTELRQLLDDSVFLAKTFEATLPMSSEDRLDDRVGSTQEECAIYTGTMVQAK